MARSASADNTGLELSVGPIAGAGGGPIVARTIDAGLLIARLHRLDEFAALRRWTTRQLTTNRQRPARPKPARTAV